MTDDINEKCIRVADEQYEIKKKIVDVAFRVRIIASQI